MSRQTSESEGRAVGIPRPTGTGDETRTEGGFTIIELLIAVALVTVLLTLAVPSYQSHLERVRRVDGQKILLDVASRQEVYYLDNRSYSADMAQLGFASTTLSPDVTAFLSENGYYSFAATAGASNSVATSYVATATRRGSQLSDALCGDLTVNSIGDTSIVNGNSTNPQHDCW